MLNVLETIKSQMRLHNKIKIYCVKRLQKPLYRLRKFQPFFTFESFVMYYIFLLLLFGRSFTGINLLGFEIIGNRISSLFGDELVMGSYLSRLFPLLFALFLIKPKLKFEIYFIGILFILVGFSPISIGVNCFKIVSSRASTLSG